LSGNGNVSGTNGFQDITVLAEPAGLSFDASFNRGGDILTLADAPGSITAYRSGSSVVLTTTHGTLTIPVGTAGMVLDFAGDERVLRYDSASATIRIGNEVITEGAGTAHPLGLLGDNFTAIA
jgi:hypothetical protein